MESLPSLILIGRESQEAPSYHMRGSRQAGPYIAFQYTLSGRGCFADFSGSYEIPAGYGFAFVSSDDDWSYGYPQDGSEPWEFLYIEFSGGNSLDVVRECISANGPVFSIALSSAIMTRLQGFDEHTWTTRQIESGESASIVFGLLATMANCGHRPRTTSEQLVDQALRYLSRNLLSPVNISSMAATLGISREHLSRVFRQQVGVSPYQYVLRERILHAAHLLRITGLNNGQIAQRSGFLATEQFVRSFKKAMGQTPQQYRRNEQRF